MSARSTRGPGGGKIHGRRPPVRRGGGRKAKQSGCAMVAIPAAVLAIVSVSVTVTPMARAVWTGPSTVAWAWHGPLMVALLVGCIVLYLGTSLLLTRLAVSPAGPRDWGSQSPRPGSNSQPVGSGLGLTAAGATRASAPAVTVSALWGTAGSGAPTAEVTT